MTNGSIEIGTQFLGNDGNENIPALIKHTYHLGKLQFKIIKEVQFVEPYEKSRTQELYSDSISVEPKEDVSGRTIFKSFVGVAPRRYMDLFSLSVERKKQDGNTLGPESIAIIPKIRRFVITYLLIEEKMIQEIPLNPITN